MNVLTIIAVSVASGLSLGVMGHHIINQRQHAPVHPAPTPTELHRRAVNYSRLAAWYEINAGLAGLRERKQQRLNENERTAEL